MLPDYYYQPVLTAGKEAMYTLDGDNNVTSPSLKANARNIMAISTEVVPEATPQSFSQRFRENWDVRQMQPFTLLPQQELQVTLRVKVQKVYRYQAIPCERYDGREMGNVQGSDPIPYGEIPGSRYDCCFIYIEEDWRSGF